MKKYIFLSLLGVFAIGLILNGGFSKAEKPSVQPEPSNNDLNAKIKNIRKFAAENNYNQDIAFFADLSVSSNKYRFFVIDLKSDKILDKGLVAHGSGSEKGKINGKLKFSNTDGSYCSSIGKYVVKNSYNGDFGKAYRLIGLDNTNSNTFSRAIVLHKYSKVPDNETTNPIVLSLGCPMVSPAFFSTLEKYIDSSEKNIVLYIYD
ncbi:murein L,D-transpeptidase catalytic domain-containing protein [Elizabethkingia bruuniana]|uniref:murein L,D-transpeptidase catalytic domain-containing protein n=1 Tax=Elizabethkingia bruuniana TaxID=1756149 RepID=UPI00241EEAAC|nr:murein L,D-transpeptidase catalytic domain family protein [Elizabethkingia bruuniana]